MSTVLVVMTASVFAQAPAGKPTFEVASVKVAEPIDMQQVQAMVRRGEVPSRMHTNPGSVDIKYYDLKSLIALAYEVKPDQVTGPDWLADQRFDIVAKYPKGATRKDLPQMMKALLEERFKLVVHKERKEHPVTALVVDKGGPKMQQSKEAPQAIDESKPLAEGEMLQDSADGPVRMKMDTKTYSGYADMGARGKIRFGIDQSTRSLKFDAEQVTMGALVEWLTFFSQEMGGGTRQMVDMTELKGHYTVSFQFPLMEPRTMARAQGNDVPAGTEAALGARTGVQPGTASDPTNSSMATSLGTAGLKLENRKAIIDQLVVDKVGKTPTEN